MLTDLPMHPHDLVDFGCKKSGSLCTGLSSIHENRGSDSGPRRKSRQHRGTGSESSIDPSDSLELVSSRRTSNSAHLDEFSDMLMTRKAHPIETEAVKTLLSMDGTASIGSSSSSSKRSDRKKRHHRVSEDSTNKEHFSSRAVGKQLSSLHVESASFTDPSEARRGVHVSPSATAGDHDRDIHGGDNSSDRPSLSQMHLGNTMRLRDVQPASVDPAPQVRSADTACYQDRIHLHCTMAHTL